MLAALLLVFGAGTAAAQQGEDPSAAAFAAFERGAAHMEAGRWQEAVGEFETSLELFPTRATVYNLGLCYQSLSKPLEATLSFERFLQDFPDATDEERAEVTRLLDELRGSIGRVSIRVSVPEAAVRVDGVAAGTSPLAEEVRVEPGPHEVEVEREGFGTQRREVVATAGRTMVVDVILEPLAPPDGGPDGSAAAAGPEGSAGAGSDEAGDGVDPLVFWSMVGVTGAATVAAAIVGGVTLAKDADYEANPDRTAAEREAGEAWAAGTDVCIGIAAAAGVATLLLAFWTDWDGDEQPDASGDAADGSSAGLSALSAFAVGDGLGLMAVGRF